jgi:hypothetical protein
MLKRVLSAAALLAFLASPALAAHCPLDVKKIDAALAGDHGLDATQLVEVKALRDAGAQLHGSGAHGESISQLHKAMDILGIEE